MLSTPDERPTRASGTNSKITPTMGIKFVTKAPEAHQNCVLYTKKTHNEKSTYSDKNCRKKMLKKRNCQGYGRVQKRTSRL